MKRAILAALLVVSLLLSLDAGAADAAKKKPLQRDETLTSGDWTELAKKYPHLNINPNANIDGDIAVAELKDEGQLASWWNAIGDDTMTELIMKSLKHNKNVRAITSRITEARAALGMSKSAVLPWLDNTNQWTNTKKPVDAGGPGSTIDIYRLGIDASWELDVFGGKKASIRAGEAAIEAELANLQSAWVSLSSEVAINYISLRTLQERLAVVQKNLALQSESLALVQSMYSAGLIDALPLNQAKYTLEQTRAMIPTIITNIERTMNLLSLLTGEIPGSLEERLSVPAPLPKPKETLLAGIPANCMRQRPDIKAAERQLAAQSERKKSAEADLLPKFQILGSVGLESMNSGTLFSSGGFSLLPKITIPIFHGGAIRSNIKVQGAREEQLLAAYEQTVLTAVAEVRDALTAEAQERVKNHTIQQGLAAAKSAVDIAKDKYKNGLTDYSNVIGAERALLSFEDELATSEGQTLSNIIRLYKALGGGWGALGDI